MKDTNNFSEDNPLFVVINLNLKYFNIFAQGECINLLSQIIMSLEDGKIFFGFEIIL